MLSPEHLTVPMLISNLTQSYVIDLGVLMLSVLIATFPTVILFFPSNAFCGRYCGDDKITKGKQVPKINITHTKRYSKVTE